MLNHFMEKLTMYTTTHLQLTNRFKLAAATYSQTYLASATPPRCHKAHRPLAKILKIEESWMHGEGLN